jgi:hypothetical protein
MAAKRGAANVIFRVGAGQPARVYRGATAIQDVPFFPPAFGHPFLAATWDGEQTYVQLTTQGVNSYRMPLLAIAYYSDADENTPLTPADSQFDGFYEEAWFDQRVDYIRAAASNAIGLGPPSLYAAVQDES